MLRPGKAPLLAEAPEEEEDKSKLRRAIKRLDMHPKIKPSAQSYGVTSTKRGIFLTGFLLLTAAFVCWEESTLFFQPVTEDFMVVDQDFGEDLIINMDISFYKLKCSEVAVDAVDYNGEQQIDVEHEILKLSRGESGQDLGMYKMQGALGDNEGETYLPPGYCGSCYGAEQREGQCCNTCEQLKRSYRRFGRSESLASTSPQCVRESKYGTLAEEFGCRVRGSLKVNKMEGNFHIAAGYSHSQSHSDHTHHVHHINLTTIDSYDMSHHIHHLSFGSVLYPGQELPLDNTDYIADGLGSLAYYIQLVPTQYTLWSGATAVTNQFSYYKHFTPVDTSKGHYKLPGVFFKYEFFPMRINYVEQSKSWIQFLIRVFAIIGGLYAILNICVTLVNAITGKPKRGDLFG